VALLQDDDYPSIRAALHVALTEDELPDTLLALDVYSGQAERRVRQAVPTLDDLPSEQRAAARTAAIYYCAAILAPRLPNLTAEGIGTYKVQAQAQDLKALAADLEQQASLALAQIPGEAAEQILAPPIFDVASGYRGR
jgi:hypothetical protein